MTALGAHPARLDLYVHPGDPIDVAVAVFDASAVEVALAGWSASAQVVGVDATVLWTFTVQIADDRIRVSATAAETAAWAWPAYAARLLVTATPPTGSPIPVASGWIRLYRP